MTAGLSIREAIRRISDEGLGPILTDAGFSKAKRARTWLREAGDVTQVVSLTSRRNYYDLQWGVWIAGVSEVVWGEPSDPSDVAYAAVTGTPGTIRQPAPYGSFQLTEDTEPPAIEKLILGVAEEARVVVGAFDRYVDRRSTWQHLAANRAPRDQRDFRIPANLALKLLTAATIAALNGDVEACGLAEEVRQLLAGRTDETARNRLAALGRVTRDLCG